MIDFQTIKYELDQKHKCKICGKYNCTKHGLLIGKIKDISKITEFEGSSPPSIFIGSRLQYPNVNVGIMSLPEISEDAWLYNAPNHWSKESFTKEQIIAFRKSLINSRFKSKVKEIRSPNANRKLLDLIQQVGMASLKPDVEIKLKKKPKLTLQFSPYYMPVGPSAELEKAKIISNPKIPKSVDKIYSDSELKSAEGLKYLYSKGLDEHSLSQILSIGITGLKKNRMLVPTRHSITAVDDTIGKHLLTKIRDYKIINEYFAYFGGHFGNYYFIMFFPEIFSYELFETILPRYHGMTTDIMTDHEFYQGRKDYAKETEGGYYAARLPILQLLENMKRQASILALRFVQPEYDIPLGVWVCRNSVRKAIESAPMKFETKNQMLEYAKQFVINKFNFNIGGLLKESKILNQINTQQKLSQWFR